MENYYIFGEVWHDVWLCMNENDLKVKLTRFQVAFPDIVALWDDNIGLPE